MVDIDNTNEQPSTVSAMFLFQPICPFFWAKVLARVRPEDVAHDTVRGRLTERPDKKE